MSRSRSTATASPALCRTRRSDTDGFRVNTDVSQDNVRGFFVFAPTHRDQIQVNFINGSSRDRRPAPSREPVSDSLSQRFETDLMNVGVGYHRIISPAADLAISAIYSDTEQTAISRLNDVT